MTTTYPKKCCKRLRYSSKIQQRRSEQIAPITGVTKRTGGTQEATVDMEMEMEAAKVVVEINLNFHGDIDILGAISVKN